MRHTRRRFYPAAMLDVADAFGVLQPDVNRDGHALWDRLGAMLTRFR